MDYATEEGHLNIISILREHLNRTGEETSGGEQALCNAIEANRASAVKQIKVSSDAKKTGICETIICAIKRGNGEILQLLLDAGGSISCEDGTPSDLIPLHQAVRLGRVSMVEDLLKRGAEIETVDELGRTALFETLNAPDTIAVPLLKNGVNESAQDSNGDTVLHEAARRGLIQHTSRLTRPIQMNLPNQQGSRPLHLAIQNQHYDVADFLVQAGAALSARDANGKLPLMYAIKTDHPKVMRLLHKNREGL